MVELDGLRGFAILAVVYYHYTTQFSKLYGYQDVIWWPFHEHLFGTPIFFMLSGYFTSVTMEKIKHPIDFIISRFSRLFPAYWFCLLTTFCVVSLADLPGRKAGFTDFVVNITMLQEFFRVPHVDAAYWFMTIEISFYAWMLVLLKSGQIKRIEYFLVVWLAAVSVWGCRDVIIPDFSLNRRIVKFLILAYGHYLTIGIVVYRIRVYGWTLFRAFLLTLCVAVILISPDNRAGLLTVCSMALFLVAALNLLPIISWRPLVFMGTISYPLYLLHQNIGYVLIRYLNSKGLNANISIPAVFCAMIVAAWAIARYLERPAIRLFSARFAAWRGRSPEGRTPGAVVQ